MGESKKKALLIRIPQDLWEALNRWAADELRSANAQIEYVLREALRKHASRPPEATHNASESGRDRDGPGGNSPAQA